MSRNKNILIFIEQRAGSINPASFQMFTAASELAAVTGGTIDAVIIGSNIAGLPEQIAKFNPSTIHLVDAPEFEYYGSQTYCTALTQTIESASAGIVLIATTSLSRDLAPRVAARLNAALATDCIEVETTADQQITIHRPMYCAKVKAFRRT